MKKMAWLIFFSALFGMKAAEVIIPLQHGLKKLAEASEGRKKPAPPQPRQRQTYRPARIFQPGPKLDERTSYYRHIKDSQSQNDLIPFRTHYQHVTRDRSFVRIVTYNVHNNNEFALGTANTDSIMNTDLYKIDPDILVLQEVPTRMLPELRERLGFMNLEIAETWSGAEGLSNVLATRSGTHSGCLSATFDGSNNKRGYVRCSINLAQLVQDPLADEPRPIKEKRELVVYGTHLEVRDAPYPSEPDAYRVVQMKVIMSQAKKDIDYGDLVVIAGDMNATDPKDYEQVKLSDGSALYDKIQRAYRTHAGHNPSKEHATLARKYFLDCFDKANIPGPLWTVWTGTRVDRLYVNKNWNLPIAGCYVYYTAESDHLPVIMDVVVQ